MNLVTPGVTKFILVHERSGGERRTSRIADICFDTDANLVAGTVGNVWQVEPLERSGAVGVDRYGVWSERGEGSERCVTRERAGGTDRRLVDGHRIRDDDGEGRVVTGRDPTDRHGGGRWVEATVSHTDVEGDRISRVRSGEAGSRAEVRDRDKRIRRVHEVGERHLALGLSLIHI